MIFKKNIAWLEKSAQRFSDPKIYLKMIRNNVPSRFQIITNESCTLCPGLISTRPSKKSSFIKNIVKS